MPHERTLRGHSKAVDPNGVLRSESDHVATGDQCRTGEIDWLSNKPSVGMQCLGRQWNSEEIPERGICPGLLRWNAGPDHKRQEDDAFWQLIILGGLAAANGTTGAVR